MNNNSQLHGTLVLVHPELQNDPVGQQGKVGILTYTDANDKIFVSFKNNVEGHYSPNALLQLKDRETLFSDMTKDIESLTFNDYRDLYKISLLQDLGRSTDIWQALEIAGSNRSIWSNSLKTIEDNMVRVQNIYAAR